ncbi:hypothetical protein FEM33_07055 [Dyadobacter flavalbus]|uniref:Uncharacterized protein n=1 Tax=Dyadobacter flavalbus TaxID=2579942 RepID=A0A5M8R081_9BACT|nr:hypothetical protein [Dyadobacter flavalbus]KAA6440356.1 hypothetical protein FEM33_07055 [Dyadobacter flavalbus]
MHISVIYRLLLQKEQFLHIPTTEYAGSEPIRKDYPESQPVCFNFLLWLTSIYTFSISTFRNSPLTAAYRYQYTLRGGSNCCKDSHIMFLFSSVTMSSRQPPVHDTAAPFDHSGKIMFDKIPTNVLF